MSRCVTIPEMSGFCRVGKKLWGKPEETGGEGSSARRFGGQDEKHPPWHQQTDPDLQHMSITHHSKSKRKKSAIFSVCHFLQIQLHVKTQQKIKSLQKWMCIFVSKCSCFVSVCNRCYHIDINKGCLMSCFISDSNSSTIYLHLLLQIGSHVYVKMCDFNYKNNVSYIF